MKANHFVYRVSWSASVAMSWADFSGIPPSYLKRFKIDSLISRGAGGGQYVVTFAPSVLAIYPTPEDAKASPEEFEHLKQSAAARVDEFLDAWILPKYKNAVKIDAAPKFHVVATVGHIFEILQLNRRAFNSWENPNGRREMSEFLAASGYPYALMKIGEADHKIIAAGDGFDVTYKLDRELETAADAGDLYNYMIIDTNGDPVHKIHATPNACNGYYGVICADATAAASLYPLDEDGEPDTSDGPDWETVRTGSRFRCYKSTRRPLVIEHTGHELYDDLAAACVRDFFKFAAENGYIHAGGDTWEKAGRKFILIEDERTPENCGASLINVI